MNHDDSISRALTVVTVSPAVAIESPGSELRTSCFSLKTEAVSVNMYHFLMVSLFVLVYAAFLIFVLVLLLFMLV